MFSEVLKIIPKLDRKDIEAMQRTLQGRFTKIAKGFGAGIKNVFRGGGWLGAAVALIDKVLNPLKETQEAMERMLKSSDDITTNAAQFNTDTGSLFKLISLAKSTGLDQDGLFMLMNKFMGAVAQNQNDPKQMQSVSAFVGEKDSAKAFFEFIQSLQKMDRNQQLLVQQQVFGEKQILKMADFLQTDFASKWSEVGLDKVSTSKLGASIDKMAGLNDLADALTARRDVNDTLAKGSIMNESMIRARDKAERIALERENAKIQSYTDLATLADTTSRIMGLVDQGMIMLGKLINVVTPTLNKIVGYLEGFSKSALFRGLFSKKGDGN